MDLLPLGQVDWEVNEVDELRVLIRTVVVSFVPMLEGNGDGLVDARQQR